MLFRTCLLPHAPPLLHNHRFANLSSWAFLSHLLVPISQFLNLHSIPNPTSVMHLQHHFFRALLFRSVATSVPAPPGFRLLYKPLVFHLATLSCPCLFPPLFLLRPNRGPVHLAPWLFSPHCVFAVLTASVFTMSQPPPGLPSPAAVLAAVFRRYLLPPHSSFYHDHCIARHSPSTFVSTLTAVAAFYICDLFICRFCFGVTIRFYLPYFENYH